MPKFKSYRTRRLVIRPLRVSDHRAWCDALDAAGKRRTQYDLDYAKPSLRLKSKIIVSVRRHQRYAREDDSYIWNVFRKSDGALVGWMDISTIKRDRYKMANFGYYIMSHQRGKGYGTEAARRLVKAGFEDLGFHRLEAATDPENKPSIALAKGIGLHDEGIKKHYWFQNNRWEDQRVFIAVPELFR